MRLSAVDIQTRDFHRRAMGYSIPDVEAFRDEIVDNFEELQTELATVREEARRLRDAVKRYEGLETNLKDTLMLAQRTSEEILSNARKEAELIIRNAEAEAREIPLRARQERAAIERELASLTELRSQFEAEFASLLSGFWQRLEGHMRRDPYAAQRQPNGGWDDAAPGQYGAEQYEDPANWQEPQAAQWTPDDGYEQAEAYAAPAAEAPEGPPPDVPLLRRESPTPPPPAKQQAPAPPPAQGGEVPEWMRPQAGGTDATGMSSSQAGLTPLDGPGR